MTKQESATRLPETSEIALVGAGLVGSLMAIFLAKRGFSVDVFERRPDMRKEKISAGRSINLAISTRGIKALLQAGLDEIILEQAVPMRGRMMHSKTGELTFQPYSKNENEYINSISRASLNKVLMSKAEETGKVRFFFQQKASGIDFDSNIAEFVDEVSGQAHKVQADIVIGTDGSASKIREEMVAKFGYAYTSSRLDYGYKELVIPALPDGGFRMERNALHIWPRGTFMLIALPNFDGSFTCTLFLPFVGDVSFESLTTKEAVAEFFNTEFGDAVPLISNVVEEFFANPTGHMDTVKCFPWNVEGRALLIGDAAHAIVPFFGQGANCGFEDLTVLEECIEEHLARGGSLYIDNRLKDRDKDKDKDKDKGNRKDMAGGQTAGSASGVSLSESEETDAGHDSRAENPSRRRAKEGSSNWQTIFNDLVSRRKVNSDAIADMAVENFTEMRDKVGDPKFLMAKAVEKLLEKEFPGEYRSRYSLVTFSNSPYKLALDAGVICDEILAELCAGIEKPDQVNMTLAKKLIHSKLTPLLKQYGMSEALPV